MLTEIPELLQDSGLTIEQINAVERMLANREYETVLRIVLGLDAPPVVEKEVEVRMCEKHGFPMRAHKNRHYAPIYRCGRCQSERRLELHPDFNEARRKVSRSAESK